MHTYNARDALTDVSGYYQQDHGCKIIKAATSLIALCNQSNHSVVYTVAKCVLPQEIRLGSSDHLCVEWGSTNTTGTSMFKISHVRCEVKT